MKRIRLKIAYDGTDFSGWQIQKNAVTIQGTIQGALCELLKEDVELIGASRTDSGVHARGNYAVFDTNTRIPAGKIAVALNQRLPESIRIQRSEVVDAEFHPRYQKGTKTYEYTILNTPIDIPTESRYCHHVYHSLNVEDMRMAAKKLVGTHDFSAFCSAGAQVKSKVRTIYYVHVEEKEIPYVEGGKKIVIRIRGNGFLYNMVRIIAGTLIEVGQGRRQIDSIDLALEEKERSQAGPTAPAKGLMLMEIRYHD